jgi:hypothetical protein
MRWAGTLALLALALTARLETARAADRLDRLREIAGRYAEGVDQEAEAALLSRLFDVVDAEVGENLASGAPFSSVAFIQERLDAFSDAWGGASFKVVDAGREKGDAALLGLFTVTRGEPRGSLRFYRPSRGQPALLAAVTHQGLVEAREWPGARQFLVSWSSPEAGAANRTLYLELWRFPPGAGPSRVWVGADTFPEGLRPGGLAVRAGQLVVRYDARYPGWKPGCADETEEEDVYRPAPRGAGLVRVRRRVVNGWHRELQSAVTRLYAALGADDRRALVDLVADPPLRERLPRDLRAEPVCDEKDPGAPGAVIVAATREHDGRRVPWSLTWRRSPRGWRVAAASPVLH